MEILTTSQMYGADKETIAKIMPEEQLMENAGFAAACEISKRYHKCPVLVICGSGNNGGDGFVVARVLQQWGWPVEVAFAGDFQSIQGTALKNARKFKGFVTLPSVARLERLKSLGGIVVDALFGIGLNRDIDENMAEYIDTLNDLDIPCIALDIPSGVKADTGEIFGTATICELTIAFERPKVGHYLYPAKDHVGELVICPIGIPDEIIENQKPSYFENTPTLFTVPMSSPYDHKYTRGSLLINGGEMTGAARLAALAARRASAGYVEVVCAPEDYYIYANDPAGTVVTPIETMHEFTACVKDPKIKAAVIGMGCGVTEETRQKLEVISNSGKPFVADAAAMEFIREIKNRSKAIITPHLGEFLRLFPELILEDKLTQALTAAEELGCIVVLKGADTVIASPEGLAAINVDTAFGLATAGSGDVLSGVIGAMLAKGLDPFEAACAGVWLHSRAGILAEESMIAEDIIANLG